MVLILMIQLRKVWEHVITYKCILILTSYTLAYGYGSIMIVFISLLSLLGLFIVPCLTRANSKGQLIIRYLLTLLTAMGVSALMCGVMFELIPTVSH